MRNSELVLLDAIKNNRFNPSASNQAIGDRLGYSPRAVSAGLSKLEAMGMIVIERRSPNAHGPGSDPTGRTIRLAEAQ